MWARVVEAMLGCWLAISPFVFRHDRADRALWVTDLACAAALAIFPLLSLRWSLRHLRYATGLVALWLLVRSFLLVPAVTPAVENHVVVALLLLMLLVIPAEVERVPRAWRTFYRRGL